MRIIVAEDDIISSTRLAQVLVGLGHEPEVHQDGGSAWEAFVHAPAGIVISDWAMPELNGLELCRNIRGIGRSDYTYFILVSAANTDEAAFDEAIEREVDDFLIKPLRRSEILRRLRVAERILTFTREIQELKSLLPICMYCKKIRNDSDYWQDVEGYFHNHTGANFSHGVCPECFAKWKRELSGASLR
jgi:DNA-binding response OmpR family regulator